MQSTGRNFSAVVEATLSSEIYHLQMMRHFKNKNEHSSGQFATFSNALPLLAFSLRYPLWVSQWVSQEKI
jgi:hypothetical protein